MHRMKRTLVLVGLAAVLLLVVIWVYGAGWFFRPKPLSADELEKTVLADDNPDGRQKAAVALIGLGKPALPNIRRVLHQATSPEVRATMLMGIAQTRDMDSVEDVFKALDDDAFVVRVQALSAMRSLLYFDRIFKPEAPHEVRVERIKSLRQQMANNKKEQEREIQAGLGKPKQGQK